MSNKIKVLLALSLAVPLAFAGAETTTESRPIIKKVETRIEAVKAKVEKRVENIKENSDKKIENLKENSGKKIENLKEEMDSSTERADKKFENLKEKMASSTERKLNKAQEQVILFTQRTVDKLNAAAGRIEILSQRTKERATIFVNNGKMTVEAKGKIDSKLAETTTILETTKTEIGKIVETAKTALLTEKPKEAFKEVQASAKKVQEDLKSAHAKVVEAITMIKASIPKEKNSEKKATTTTNQ